MTVIFICILLRIKVIPCPQLGLNPNLAN